ncbi:galactose-1-phosphate uridylyltransferase [Parachaetomium inaequale]|uniref:Carboxylic ester hydrolase n=1 Tax=Parachaetomium inaequale TaxID=2588326 RepID=A0AAN6PA20_9PEZI|nr:galactose-1-phosphate uridylyltransferase [Parachaetomium inaequale]
MLIRASEESAFDRPSFRPSPEKISFMATKRCFVLGTVAFTKEPPLVQTKNGTFIGLRLASLDQELFLGIPYGSPPVGPLRFKHPQPYTESWAGARNAIAHGPHCPGYGTGFTHSEDCLTINVVRPGRRQNHGPLPVAVYIYGGGSHGGGSSDGRYNLSFLIASATQAGLPFIGVTFNYRSSIWGFIASRQIRGRGDTNIGLHDQRLALHWVQENIVAFGGDPRKVTLWGGSSGADNVGRHLLAYGGRDEGLFRAAILQSGGPVSKTSLASYPVQDIYDRLLRDTGCQDAEDALACLRHLPYANLNGAFQDSPDASSPSMVAFSLPVIDGDFIPTYGSLSLKGSHFVRVPIITGVVSNEGSTWIPKEYPPPVIDRLMDLYPPIARQEGGELDPPIESITNMAEFTRIEQLFGDLVINAANRLLCESYAVSTTCYTFRFNALVSHREDRRLGAIHGTEIGPLFQNTDGLGFYDNPFSGKGEGFHHMSHLMGMMWAGFITRLDPNAGFRNEKALWPRFTLQTRYVVVFNESGSLVEQDTARFEAMRYLNEIQHSVFER